MPLQQKSCNIKSIHWDLTVLQASLQQEAEVVLICIPPLCTDSVFNILLFMLIFNVQSHQAALSIHLWPQNRHFHGWPQVALDLRRRGKEAQWWWRRWSRSKAPEHQLLPQVLWSSRVSENHSSHLKQLLENLWCNFVQPPKSLNVLCRFCDWRRGALLFWCLRFRAEGRFQAACCLQRSPSPTAAPSSRRGRGGQWLWLWWG